MSDNPDISTNGALFGAGIATLRAGVLGRCPETVVTHRT